MALGGGSELHRAKTNFGVSTGGVTDDVSSLQAAEDRRIKAVDVVDTGGVANVLVESSFSSTENFGGGPDHSRASTIAFHGFEEQVEVDLEWSAGEEVHFHTRNNSGSGENAYAVIYYEEV